MQRSVGVGLAAAAVLVSAGLARAQSPNDHDHFGQTWVGWGDGLYVSSQNGYGLRGTTWAPNATGVLGASNSSTGNGAGVQGESWAPVGAGVYGVGRGTNTMGVYGDTAAPGGIGVYGLAENTTGANKGVVGQTWSPQGVGVYGEAPFPGSAGFFRGNTVVADPGSLSFGSSTRQMLNLWGPNIYGIGVQPFVMYFRTDGGTSRNGFAWFKGGSHANAAYDPGGGTVLMTLDQRGLTVNGTFVSSSDAAAKQDLSPVDVQQVLEGVGRLPINEWSYRDDPATRHLGPMAQAFRSAFGLGGDERHIAMVDADGIALAAIQALRQRVADQQAEIAELRAHLAAQEGRLEALARERPQRH